MLALSIILAVFVLIALLRVGAAVKYGEDGVAVSAHVGPFRLSVFPRKVKTKVKTDKKVKKETKKAEAPDKAEKPGRLKGLYDLLPAVSNTLGRLRRKLLIKHLTIHYLAGGSDPIKAALSFGTANAVFGTIVPVLENSFRIKERDLRASADFEAGEPQIFVSAALSLAVWEAVYIAFGMFPVLAGRKQKSNGKDEKKYGKAPDR